MFFTRDQIAEIIARIKEQSVKDTQLPDAGELAGDEKVAIVKNLKNKLTSLDNLVKYLIQDGNFLDEILDYIGTDSLGLKIESSNGEIIIDDLFDITLTAKVYFYFNDISNRVEEWTWTRYTGDTEDDIRNDLNWNESRKNEKTSTITIDEKDLSEHQITTIICEARINNEKMIAIKQF